MIIVKNKKTNNIFHIKEESFLEVIGILRELDKKSHLLFYNETNPHDYIYIEDLFLIYNLENGKNFKEWFSKKFINENNKK